MQVYQSAAIPFGILDKLTKSKDCILSHLKTTLKCPVCNLELSCADVYPNPILNQILNSQENNSFENNQLENSKENNGLEFFLKSVMEKKSLSILQLQKELETLKQDYSSISKSTMTLPTKMQERILGHQSDLENVYFKKRDMGDFSKDLQIFSKFSKFRTSAVLHYADNFFNYASSIVSSIEFDKDDEYFAIAGVTKKIRIFEFKEVVRDYRNFRSSYRGIEDHEVKSIFIKKIGYQ